jgi:hypothetical protein
MRKNDKRIPTAQLRRLSINHPQRFCRGVFKGVLQLRLFGTRNKINNEEGD